MFLVDSHCHLDGLDYESLHKDVDDVLAKAAARDVKFVWQSPQHYRVIYTCGIW
ncbi:metallodependent hydrolase [Escherichia coli]|uniref:Metallodependent hydrolase n=1 Tax=Escherichia coli TaxID=562 RepID=A0A376W5B3_ECOLX|nr:metallodependent hydrolase [Escherichia coli]